MTKYAPVGATVYNSFCDDHYTVESHNDNGTVTVRWHGDTERFVGPYRRTHRISFDPNWETVITHTEVR